MFGSATRIAIITTGAMLAGACATNADTANNSQNKFSIATSASYALTSSTSPQFDIGYSVDFIPVIPPGGTAKHTCEAGFKFAPQNKGISKVELNEFARSEPRKQQVKSILGNLFVISSFVTKTIQGHVGYKMDVRPKTGPDVDKVRGQVIFVETAEGRMTQICFTDTANFKSAALKFSGLTNAIRLPE